MKAAKSINKKRNFWECDFNIYSFSLLNSPVGVAVKAMFYIPTNKGDQQMPGGHL